MAAPQKSPPEKSVIQLMPAFDGLPLSAIHVPRDTSSLDLAWQTLSAQRFIGFDTESKPTFQRGEVSSGPDVVQFATLESAWIFQLRETACHELVRALLSQDSVVKVGFGLDSDHAQLHRRLQASVAPVLDLDLVFRKQGYARTIGVKNALAVVAQQCFTKSKQVTTSNWSVSELQDRQLLYAANDAYAALRVLHALKLPESALPIQTQVRQARGRKPARR